MAQISFAQSMEAIEQLKTKQKPYENVMLTQAVGRVLAQDIIASAPNPEYETAAMDGYAIKHSDMEKKIQIIGDNPAGNAEATMVEKGQCIKTFTGALMPKGSDTLVPIENVSVNGDILVVDEKVPDGFATRAVGEIYKKDELLIKKGTRIGYAQIGVLASLNIASVAVVQKPRVAVLSSGSEILDIAQPRQNSSQIRSSNHLVFEVLAKEFGCEVQQLGVVSDDKKQLLQKIESGLESSDIVVTSGGVSVGDYDFTKEIIKSLGAKIIFHGVNIKPGQHLLLAQKGDKFILSLPGFAYSATVTLLLYLPKLLQKFSRGTKQLQSVRATIEQEYKKPNSKKAFVAVNCYYEAGGYKVDLSNKKDGSSAILTNMLEEAALMVLDEKIHHLQKGDSVEVVLLQ